MAGAMMTDAAPSSLRLVLNVGGVRFETTRQTIEKSLMLIGLVDTAPWEDEPEAGHVPELFLDRDPTLFGTLLRLMRATPVFGGQLPKDDQVLCAAILAEADYLGFEALLTHVKARAYRNLMGAGIHPEELVNVDQAFFRPETIARWLAALKPYETTRGGRCQVFQGFRVNPGPLESGTLALGMPQPSPASKIQALLEEEGITELWQLPKILKLKLKPFGQNNANNLWPNQWEALQAAVQLLEFRDDVDAARAFELVHGSIAEALDSEMLPKCYFQRLSAKGNLALGEPSIAQLLPVEAPTYFLVGDVWDNRYLVQAEGAPGQYGGPDVEYDDGEPVEALGVDTNDDYDEMTRMDEWIRQPAVVRRVACHALMEQKLDDGTVNKFMEPLLYLTTQDQEAFMNDQIGSIFRHHTLSEPTLKAVTEGGANRTMPASRFLRTICNETLCSGHASEARRTPQTLWTHLLVTDSPPTEVGFAAVPAWVPGHP